jgi:uncharacterized membrane protein
MIDYVRLGLTFVSAIGSGLMGGVFFAFSVFVMKALSKLPPAQGIAAMQSINVVVLNPGFLLVFAGTAVACVVLAILACLRWSEPGAAWLLAGGVLYVAGNFLVTMAGNVPLNDALAAVDPQGAGAAARWADYLSRWMVWNHVRTLTGAAALAAFIVALCRRFAAGS